MQIDNKDIFKINNMSKQNYIDQPLHMYWDAERGEREVEFDEKRLIAILEAASVILGLDIDINYRTREKDNEDVS